MPLPRWIDHFSTYWSWLEKLIDESGGYMVDGVLDVQFLGADPDNPVGFLVQDQRLRFWDESFLEFTILVNQDLELEMYNFHYQERDNAFVWRKDKHTHHEEEVGGLTHIHDDPSDEDAVRPYPEVDLAEVLQEIHEHQERTGERF